MLIQRLSDIDYINELEQNFAQEYGIRPYNISSWHISNSFREEMLRSIELPHLGNKIDYLYTYNLDVELKKEVIIKLGGRPENSMLLVTPNNTISIINVSNLLREYGYQNICIVNPAYFSVAHVMKSMGMDFNIESMVRENQRYSFPLDKIVARHYDAVWITSPIYSAGVYLDPVEIAKIQTLINQGIMVIADESFALNGCELISALEPREHFIGIYSPHKAICCNGIKFSAVLASSLYEDFLEQWVDVLSGNLPPSSVVAVSHFVSRNYDHCTEVFCHKMQSTRLAIEKGLIEKGINTDFNSIGNLTTLYFENIPFQDKIAKDFYIQMYRQTYTSIYPGYLNGFGPDIGFCFRINLALDSLEFHQALQRITIYLSEYCTE